MPRTPPGERADSDDDDEGWDLPNGHDMPMTPDVDLYSPASPEPEPM